MPTLNLLPINILQIVFLVQMSFAIFILLPNKKNRSLVYLLIAVIILMLFNLLEELRVTYDFYLVTPSFSLLFGPLFYFLVYQLAMDQLLENKRVFTHLIPAIISLLFTEHVQFVLALGTISQFVYFVMGLKLVRIYQKAIFDNCSDALSLQLTWLRNILLTMIVITAIDMTRLNLQPILDFKLASYWYFMMQLAFYFLTSYLVICAIHYPERFTGLNFYIEQANKIEKDKNHADSIFAQIDQIIVTEKLYKQPRLSLQDLQHHIGVSTKELSNAINNGSNLNFCDYINQHRINEIKRSLDKCSDVNLLQLAFDSGFNSKSSFNKSFKKLVNMTPTQYLKSVKS